MMLEQNTVDRIIRTALEEDLGSGDLTTNAIIRPDSKGRAVLIAKQNLVLAGLPVFKRTFEILNSDVGFEAFFEDGQSVTKNEKVCEISSSVQVILKAERTGLNLLQRMSGIATLTQKYAEQIKDFKAKVLDTRKTNPGLRILDKYAVRMGGGYNHRFGLYDGIIIKDNHIQAAGSITKALSLCRQSVPHTIKIEIEVEDLDGVAEALEAGADIIMLDNMPLGEIKKAVEQVKGRSVLEVSGNVNLENIKSIAATGVDLISVGALTHSAPAADLSLELIAP
jgi:nicotinate-nucleotide pyrophosphorylase (carboxylating)